LAKRSIRRGHSAAAQPLGEATALVVGAHGRHCTIELETGLRMLAYPKGKRSEAVVGDHVHWRVTGDEAVIDRVATRRSLLYRQDELRTKSFAANVDQAVLVLAAEPVYPQALLDRTLLACEASHVRVLIVLNKSDLTAAFAQAWNRLLPYQAMGYTLLPLSLRTPGPPSPDGTSQALGLEELHRHLQGQTNLILGPSGAGKSTLVNHLVPDAAAATGEISAALGTGRHTTTSTRWYWLDRARGSALVDSPGFQDFGLHHLHGQDIAALMPDLRVHLGHCRFANCSHLHEPGCGVRAQLAGATAPSLAECPPASSSQHHSEETTPQRPPVLMHRYHFYSNVMAELAQLRNY
jgi:ribosome biogenesis GTPase / thiamine phosphate phosphatase